MELDQQSPVPSWVHGNKLNRIQARLCKEHAKFVLSNYNTETAENKKLGVFMPKLVSNHKLGGCEALGCSNNSEYIAYGLTYNINVQTEKS